MDLRKNGSAIGYGHKSLKDNQDTILPTTLRPHILVYVQENDLMQFGVDVWYCKWGRVLFFLMRPGIFMI